MNARPKHNEDKLSARVVAIRYQSSEQNFAVLNVQEATGQAHVAVGPLHELRVGTEATFFGRREQSSHGPQFRVEHYDVKLPEGREEIEAFLSAGFVSGVGPDLARRMVEHFGERTLDIMRHESARLTEVHGIGKKKAARIKESFAEEDGQAASLGAMLGMGLGASIAHRFLREVGANAVDNIRADPYAWIGRVRGFGFATADDVGKALQVDPRDPRRVAGLVLHILDQETARGHTFVPHKLLATKLVERLETADTNLEFHLRQLQSANKIVIEGESVFPKSLHRAETRISESVRALLATEVNSSDDTKSAPLETTTLSEEQRAAVLACLKTKLFILTGGPGTGKTTTLRAIVEAHSKLGRKVRLASPTGRAAKRLSDATAAPASTVHRLLEWNAHQRAFSRNRSNPVEGDVVVVDEASMLDVELCADLLDAAPNAYWILVGDAEQLAPVGPGFVFRELLTHDAIPRADLQQVFRQSAGSAIVAGAHAIRGGNAPEFSPAKAKDDTTLRGELFHVPCERADIADRVVAVALRLRAVYSLDPIRDLAVLTAMRKGTAGTEALNQRLQAALLDARNLDPSQRFCTGDKVMQIKNDYDREVLER